MKTMSVHVTLIPYISTSNEIKTKPTQNSVKELMSYGIVVDCIVCRTSMSMLNSDINKPSTYVSNWRNHLCAARRVILSG